MGPSIILDKSIFQRLPADREAVFLRKYFLLNVPPVLLDEIRANLSKKDVRTSPEVEVQGLSRKLSQFNSAVSMPYGDMLRFALLGADVPMDGRIILRGVQEPSNDGGHYTVAHPCESENDYLRWQKKNYTALEYEAANVRRSSIPSEALEKSRNSIKDLRPDLMAYQSIDALAKHVEDLLSIPECRRDLLEFVLRWCTFEKEGLGFIVGRWENAGKPPLKEFAPYAHFCMKVLHLHKAGLIRGFFTTRAKDLFDLEYVFYLPFCNVFSSSDNFLKAIVPPLLGKHQQFIDGDDLKKDLEQIVASRDGLEGNALSEWLAIHEASPPANSRVYFIRKQLGWEQDRRPKVSEKPLTMDDLKSAGAVWRKRRVALDGPCICGSPMSFRECHYSRMKQ